MVHRSFRKRGIEMRTGAQVKGFVPRPTGLGGVLHLGEGPEIEVDMVVVSVGRRPRTEGLVAEGTAVVIDERGFVVADRYQRTHEPGVWAVGDVVGRDARSWPTSVSPKRSSRSSACSASRWCRSTTTGCRGPSTATPRSPSPA